MGPTWVLWAPDGPMLAPWTLLSGQCWQGITTQYYKQSCSFMHELTMLWWDCTVITLMSHENHGVSNHLQLDCLFNRLSRQSATDGKHHSYITSLGEGNHQQCMKWPVAHSPNSTWFWLELVGNCCEQLKIIVKYTNIQFYERRGHGLQFHPLHQSLGDSPHKGPGMQKGFQCHNIITYTDGVLTRPPGHLQLQEVIWPHSH